MFFTEGLVPLTGYSLISNLLPESVGVCNGGNYRALLDILMGELIVLCGYPSILRLRLNKVRLA